MSINIRDAVRKYGPEYLAVCGLAKYFPVMNSESSVFFVKTGGSDSAANQGQTPDTPLLTITKALDLCTDAKNDFIFILDYYQSTGETWPISIAKGLIHIIGISQRGCPWPWVQPSGDKAAFSLTTGGKHIEIAGLELGAGASYGCISIDTSGLWGLHVHDCNFGTVNGMTGAYGINMPAGEMIYGLIENNKFGYGLTASGICVPTNAGPNSVHGAVIQNNLFRVLQGKGIDVLDTTADFDEGGIFNNKFSIPDSGDGEAVDFASGAVGMVDGNTGVKEDGDAPTQNPFKDAGTGMGWGINYKGGTALIADPA